MLLFLPSFYDFRLFPYDWQGIIQQYQTHTNRPKSCGISLLVKQLHLNHAKHSLSQEVCWIQGHPMTRPLISPPIGTPNGKSPFFDIKFGNPLVSETLVLKKMVAYHHFHVRNHLLTTPFLLPANQRNPACTWPFTSSKRFSAVADSPGWSKSSE